MIISYLIYHKKTRSRGLDGEVDQANGISGESQRGGHSEAGEGFKNFVEKISKIKQILEFFGLPEFVIK